MHIGYRYHQGAALVFAMIFMVVLTLIGLTSMRTATLEERMASNQQDYYRAFDAAELALRTAESDITSGYTDETAIGFSNTTYADSFSSSGAGRYNGHSLSSRIWTTIGWSNTDSIQVSGIEQATSSNPPRYIIEYLRQVVWPPKVGTGTNVYNDSDIQNIKTRRYYDIFRITAQGTSGRSGSVLLQETFVCVDDIEGDLDECSS